MVLMSATNRRSRCHRFAKSFQTARTYSAQGVASTASTSRQKTRKPTKSSVFMRQSHLPQEMNVCALNPTATQCSAAAFTAPPIAADRPRNVSVC